MASKESRQRRMREGEGGGSFLAFFLGILMGIIGIVGGIVGVCYYAATKPVKDTVNLIDGSGKLYEILFNEDSGFISPDYADQLLGDLVKDSAVAVMTLANGGSLSEIAKISPKVSSLVDTLIEKSDYYGLNLSKEEILAKPVGELMPYLEESINDAPLGNLLQGQNKVELTDPLLLAICYGSPEHYEKVKTDDNVLYEMKQVTYEYYDRYPDDDDATKKLYDVGGSSARGTFDPVAKTLTLKNGTIEYLKLEDTIGEKEIYLAYEDSAFTVPVIYKYTTIGSLSEDSSSLFNDLYLRDALGIKNAHSSHPVLIALAYGVEGKDYTIKPDGSIELAEGSHPRTIGELKEEDETLIDSILLKDALGVDATSPKVLRSLAFGAEEVDYTIDDKVVEDGKIVSGTIRMLGDSTPRTLGDLTENGGEDLINGLYLADIIDPDPTSTINMYLLYGREGVHWAEVDGKIVSLNKKVAVIGTTTYNEWGENPLPNSYASGVYTDAEGNGYVCKPLTPAKTVKTVDGEATLYELVDSDGVPIGQYAPTSLGSFATDGHLTRVTSRMTIVELLGEETVNDNIFLQHLRDETIDTLPDSIEGLTYNEVFKNDAYVDPTADPESRVLKGKWAYLLKDPTTGMEAEYKITELDALVDNMTKNVQTATLDQLYLDKMLTVVVTEGEPSPLDSSIKGTTLYTAGSKETLGDLNINELFKLVGELLSYVPST